jgi:uncharacterized protein (UPF0332 family)
LRGKFYDRLFDDRQEGDYLALASFTADEVKAQIEDCTRFLEMLRPFISSLA